MEGRMTQRERLIASFFQHQSSFNPTITPRDAGYEPVSASTRRDDDVEPSDKRRQTDCIVDPAITLNPRLPIVDSAAIAVQREPTKVPISATRAEAIAIDVGNPTSVKARDHLLRFARLYKIDRTLGSGSQGFVWAVHNVQTGKMSAMKVISEVGSDPKSARYALREIKYLLQLRHRNVIQIEEVLGERNLPWSICSYIIIQMELMDSCLFDCIKKRKAIVTEPRGIANCMFQLLDGIHFIHSAGIVHRDLSTGNILVDENKRIFKISDFDLARKLESADTMTEEVTTPSFRAPEITLTPSRYSYSMDIWALGCVLYNLFNMHPFVPYSMHMRHIANIVAKIGLEEQDVDFILDIDKRRNILNRYQKPKVPWSLLCPTVSEEGLSLLNGLLQFNPDRRLTAAQALNSEFLASAKPADHDPVKYTGAEMVNYNYSLTHKGYIDRLQQCITVDVSAMASLGSEVTGDKSSVRVPAPINVEQQAPATDAGTPPRP